MRVRCVHVLLVSASLIVLGGCGSVEKAVLASSGHASVETAPAGADVTGSTTGGQGLETPATLEDAGDDLALGKRHYREGNFGLAERYFRRAVEQGQVDAHRSAEAWLGLAAAYDRLHRFDLADRAYARALKILGPTAAVLNNQGYSYLLRGDLNRARAKLLAARDLDPASPYIRNNLALLDQSAHGKVP